MAGRGRQLVRARCSLMGPRLYGAWSGTSVLRSHAPPLVRRRFTLSSDRRDTGAVGGRQDDVRVRFRRALSRVLLLALCVAPGLVVATEPAAASAASCPAMQVFAVRGSGQKVVDDNGYAQPLFALYQNLKIRLPAMRAMPLDYTAVPVQWWHPITYDSHYIESVNDGIAELRASIDGFISSPCGNGTLIYLAGYSQGAEVVDDVLQTLTPRTNARIDGVVLFGDPRFNPTQAPDVDQGSYRHTLSGVAPSQFAAYYGAYPVVGAFGTLVSYSSSEAPRVRSYCTSGDPVCSYTTDAALKTCFPKYSPAGSPDCPHYTYGWQTFGAKKRDYVSAATEFLLKRWQATHPGATLRPRPRPRPAPARQVVAVHGRAVTRIGPLNLSSPATNNHPLDAVSTFGPARTLIRERFRCKLTWPGAHLTLDYENFGGASGPGCTSAFLQYAVLGTSWRTDRGLMVGTTVRRLHQTYPHARWKPHTTQTGAGGWLLTPSYSPVAGGLSSPVTATVNHDRVSAFEVWVGGAGE